MRSDVCIFDYDGTLCAPGASSISSEIIQLLKTMQSKFKMVLATGRPRLLVPEIPGFRWDAAVYYNGQLCVMENRVIHRQLLEDHEWRSFCQVAMAENVEFLAFSDRITALRPLDRLPSLLEVTGTEIVIGEPLNEPFLYKIIMEPSWSAQGLAARYMPSAQIVKWHSDFWEIVPGGVDKCSGVERALPHMDRSWDQVIAFGDSGNDCLLFRKASCSFAIGDQCQELVRLATWVAPAIEENGLEWAISKIMRNGGWELCIKRSAK